MTVKAIWTTFLDSKNRRGAAGRARGSCTGLALLALVTMPVAAVAQQPTSLRPGDIVVLVGSPGAPGPGGALVKVDPSTGQQTILSDFGDPTQGPVGNISDSVAFTIENSTTIIVFHPQMGTEVNGLPMAALLRVDPTTGVRAIISDFGDASQGPVNSDLRGNVAIEASGDFLVAWSPGLVRVNRLTGMRTIVSDFSNSTQGFRVSQTYRAIGIEKSGQVVVADFHLVASPYGLVRVDPSTGVRTLFSDFRNIAQGPADIPHDLTIDHSGNILVSVGGFAFCGEGCPTYQGILRVDAVTGVRTLLTEFLDDEVCRVRFGTPQALAVAESGDIIATAFVAADLFRVDPNTGVCALLSVTGSTYDVAAVPTPLVNDMVSLSVASTVLEPSTGDPLAPAGALRITAEFTNLTGTPIRSPFVRVAELSGGNRLVSGDRPPDLIRAGGKGTRQTPDVGKEGVLAPGESVTVEFGIGLQTRQPFTFFVDVFGEPDRTAQ